jgi:drug/metabolite transporter (DMT)-like permease
VILFFGSSLASESEEKKNGNSIMVMFVAQVIYFFGVQASNMTIVSYTMLAFPVVSLVFELILGRVRLSSLGMYDLGGCALLVAGYVVIMSKPQLQ